jgi:hypothetical protein
MMDQLEAAQCAQSAECRKVDAVQERFDTISAKCTVQEKEKNAWKNRVEIGED